MPAGINDEELDEPAANRCNMLAIGLLYMLGIYK